VAELTGLRWRGRGERERGGFEGQVNRGFRGNGRLEGTWNWKLTFSTTLVSAGRTGGLTVGTEEPIAVAVATGAGAAVAGAGVAGAGVAGAGVAGAGAGAAEPSALPLTPPSSPNFLFFLDLSCSFAPFFVVLNLTSFPVGISNIGKMICWNL
jgi:hypothetical protein